MDYLTKEMYDKECIDIGSHTREAGAEDVTRLWKRYDSALWAFAHVRRAYAGCPVGIAIGDPNKFGILRAALIIWHKKNDNGPITHSFWNPMTPTIEGVDFSPRKIFV